MRILDLPSDALAHAFAFLELKDIVKCALVSRDFQEAAESPLLWRELYARDIEEPMDAPTELSWKDQYKEDCTS